MTEVSTATRKQQIYTKSAEYINQAVQNATGKNSEISKMSNKIPSILNGTYDATGEVVNGLPLNNTGKLVVGSALDLLKTYLMKGKGFDTKDAMSAIQKSTQSSNLIKTQTTTTNADITNLVNETRTNVENDSAQIEEKGQSIDEMNQENTQIQQEIDKNNEKIQELTQENQKNEAELQDLIKELNLGDNAIASTDNSDTIQNGDENNNGGSTSYQEIDAKSMPNVDSSKLERYNELVKLLNKNSGDIATLTQTNTTHTETITQNKANIDSEYQQMDQLANNFSSVINTAKGAADNLTNVLKGNQQMFSQEQVISAGTQMAKAAINGTEGGVLAAFATAAGVSSLFTFGATAMQAEQAAEASADKFAGAIKRGVSQAAISKLEQVTNQAVNNALSQMTSMTGINFSDIYSNAIQIYQTASAGNPNGSSDVASISTSNPQQKTEQSSSKPTSSSTSSNSNEVKTEKKQSA